MLRLLALALTLATLPACLPAPAPEAASEGGIWTINGTQLALDREAGKVAVLLDVRTPSEFAAGHVPGARNIPLDELKQHLRELDRETPVYVMCHSGVRSLGASQLLKNAGYYPVNVEDGWRGWSGEVATGSK